MITNIKTYIKTLRLNVGDILYDGNPKNVKRPAYKIVLTKRKDRKECGLFHVSHRRRTSSNIDTQSEFQPFAFISSIDDNIYKIEDIKEEDIKYILKIFKEENSTNYDYPKQYVDGEMKELFDNVINIWIKRYPRVKEILEQIEIEQNISKYNI